MKNNKKLLTQTLRHACACLALLSLSGCGTITDIFNSGEKKVLEGERLSVLELQKTLEPDAGTENNAALSLPAPWDNQFWPQRGGYPNHSMQNLTLGTTGLSPAWTANIGDGSTSELPLIAEPIVVAGYVYTLDTQSRLRAFDTQDGKEIWDTNIRDSEEDDPVIGGGLAYAKNIIYATSGYDEILALNAKTGDIIWRNRLPAAARAAPTIMDNRLFVMTLDNRLLALQSETGDLLWEYVGLNETAGIVGAASPAANTDIVIPAFSSGELSALRVENGSIAWSDNLTNLRRMGGLESLADIKALPVIDQGIIIAISFSGRMVAIDERTGSRIWQRDISGSETPWVAGNNIFVLSSDSELVALNKQTGAILWVTQMPKYEDEDDKEGKIFWKGPLLADGLLLLAGSNGQIQFINPASGALDKTIDTDEPIALAPIIAAQTLYLLHEDGTLSAWR